MKSQRLHFISYCAIMFMFENCICTDVVVCLAFRVLVAVLVCSQTAPILETVHCGGGHFCRRGNFAGVLCVLSAHLFIFNEIEYQIGECRGSRLSAQYVKNLDLSSECQIY